MSVVALLRLSALGDILLSEPVPRQLKERDPECRVVYLTREKFASIPRGWPAVDEVLALPDKITLADLRALKRQLNTQGEMRRIDLHNNLRSHLLWPVCEARLPKHRLQKLLLVHAKWLPRRLVADPGPVWKRYLRLAGVENPGDEQRPRLVVSGQRLTWGARRHELLVPGSGLATKAWPGERWVEFLPMLLKATELPIMVLGGGRERPLGRLLEALAPKRVKNLCGVTSLDETARWVADARRILCGDTGLLHMADAADVPGVALFGSTTRELGFFPAGKSLRTLEQDLSCRPCSHIGRKRCPLGHFKCMMDFAARDVLEHYLKAGAATC